MTKKAANKMEEPDIALIAHLMKLKINLQVKGKPRF